ncbi:MAG: response regulator [Planctomycetes bacterium]|nr:response regulator [Planctomycetota bacterium]
MALNVLVVDDSMVGRAMVIKSLKLSGVDVGEIHQASNGREGLDVLEAHWVDLVFADINMPVMNGEEMIDRIRANPAWAATPIVVISTEGSQTHIERLVARNARFVHKPFTPEVIRDVIRDIVGVPHESR